MTKNNSHSEDKQHLNDSNVFFENNILLSLECWTKYIEGFTKGLQANDKVNPAIVLDCIGEVLEFMTTFKKQLTDLFMYCESILEENEILKQKINDTCDKHLLDTQQQLKIEQKEDDYEQE